LVNSKYNLDNLAFGEKKVTVHFVTWDASFNMLEQVERLYEKAGTLNCIEKGDIVAIKLHIGELGNPYYIQPMFLHDLVRKIQEAGGKPFLTDSNTLYKASRSNACDHMANAKMNGFSDLPFIVADGLRGENYRTVKTKGILKEIEVSGAIAEADAMIVVTHCKGHELSGFGGAIKNLGMGCTSSKGKLRQHRVIGLEIDQSKCTGCGKCKEVCDQHLPDIIEGKAQNSSPLCMRCPFCMGGCPSGAITLTHKDDLCRALASAAYGVLSTFKQDKVAYVSFAKDITEFCDCRSNPGQKVMPDIGVFASNSAVEADAAFLTKADYEIFNEAYGVNCLLQIKEAKAIGIRGSLEPKINTVA
jgi:uncharacterized protein